MTKQRGTFYYPGSKTLIRRWVIDHIPEHHLYVEPFGGAASILVGKSRSPVEVYNDINSDCVTFFEAVKSHGDKLAEWIDNTPYSRELFDRWVSEYPDWPDDVVEHAGRFAFIQHASFGGKGIDSGSPHFSVTKVSTRPDASDDKTWDRKPADIEWLKSRFKKIQIENDDYAEIVDRYDGEEVFFYCDPPYLEVGDSYYQTENGGFDHSRFMDILMGIDGRWLVSYDQNMPSELTDFNTVYRDKKSGLSSDNQSEKIETLTMNYDPDNTPMFREQEQTGLEQYD